MPVDTQEEQTSAESRPGGEPEPVVEPQLSAEDPEAVEPGHEAPAVEPEPTPLEAEPAAEPGTVAAPEPDPDAGSVVPDLQPAVGPKILGVAPEAKPLPIVKAKLREKPKREPLPWPELRSLVATIGADLDKEGLKELFRLLPSDVRDETIEGVREFRKGARRPLSQHAAKQLARAVHTSRRLKKKNAPSTDVSDALAQAIVGELIASLDVELAAEVILPKRDLIDRESRASRRRQKDEEDRAKKEQQRKRREDNKGIRGTMSFGEFTGPKIKGLDALDGLFGDAPAPERTDAEPEAVEPEAVEPEAAEPEAAEPEAVEPESVEPEPDAPVNVEPSADDPASPEAEPQG